MTEKCKLEVYGETQDTLVLDNGGETIKVCVCCQFVGLLLQFSQSVVCVCVKVWTHWRRCASHCQQLYSQTKEPAAGNKLTMCSKKLYIFACVVRFSLSFVLFFVFIFLFPFFIFFIFFFFLFFFF